MPLRGNGVVGGGVRRHPSVLCVVGLDAVIDAGLSERGLEARFLRVVEARVFLCAADVHTRLHVRRQAMRALGRIGSQSGTMV